MEITVEGAERPRLWSIWMRMIECAEFSFARFPVVKIFTWSAYGTLRSTIKPADISLLFLSLSLSLTNTHTHTHSLSFLARFSVQAPSSWSLAHCDHSHMPEKFVFLSLAHRDHSLFLSLTHTHTLSFSARFSVHALSLIAITRSPRSLSHAGKIRFFVFSCLKLFKKWLFLVCSVSSVG